MRFHFSSLCCRHLGRYLSVSINFSSLCCRHLGFVNSYQFNYLEVMTPTSPFTSGNLGNSQTARERRAAARQRRHQEFWGGASDADVDGPAGILRTPSTASGRGSRARVRVQAARSASRGRSATRGRGNSRGRSGSRGPSSSAQTRSSGQGQVNSAPPAVRTSTTTTTATATTTTTTAPRSATATTTTTKASGLIYSDWTSSLRQVPMFNTD